MSTAISSPDNGRTIAVTVTVDMSKYGKNDAAANAYAEANHDDEWYVLDAAGRNINA